MWREKCFGFFPIVPPWLGQMISSLPLRLEASSDSFLSLTKSSISSLDRAFLMASITTTAAHCRPVRMSQEGSAPSNSSFTVSTTGSSFQVGRESNIRVQVRVADVTQDHLHLALLDQNADCLDLRNSDLAGHHLIITANTLSRQLAAVPLDRHQMSNLTLAMAEATILVSTCQSRQPLIQVNTEEQSTLIQAMSSLASQWLARLLCHAFAMVLLCRSCSDTIVITSIALAGTAPTW